MFDKIVRRHKFSGHDEILASFGKSSSMSDITDWTATTLRDEIHARRVSSREVMTAFLDRIARVNPGLNAIVSRVPDEILLAEAAQCDTEAEAGQFRGPLHGFPIAIKDLSQTRGIPTTMGATTFAHQVPTDDGLAVSRVRRAGAIFSGKTNVPEFGLGSHTTNPVFGATRNPYDRARSAGGSSGGAAVALSARMAPLADGSDFGGSLRNPAGWNNVFGFRPTSGRVPKLPSPDVFFSQMGYEGPMARTVTDLALLLSVQAGYDARAPLSLRDDPNCFTGPLERDMGGLKIGWLGSMGGLPMEDGVLKVCEAALATFTALGAHVEPTNFPIERDAIWQAWLGIRHWSVGNGLRALYDDPHIQSTLSPQSLWEIEGSLSQTGKDIYNATVGRTRIAHAFLNLFERFDYLALPTAQLFPFDVSLPWPTEIAGVPLDTYHRWMEVTFAVSLSGCPAIAVPAGFGGTFSLPMGLQLIAPHHTDLDLLKVAFAYEQASPWIAQKRPPEAQTPSVAAIL